MNKKAREREIEIKNGETNKIKLNRMESFHICNNSIYIHYYIHTLPDPIASKWNETTTTKVLVN